MQLLNLYYRLERSGKLQNGSGLCLELREAFGYLSYEVLLFMDQMSPPSSHQGDHPWWGSDDNYAPEHGVFTDLRKNLLLLFAYAYEDLK